jgi:hypothetical protein
MGLRFETITLAVIPKTPLPPQWKNWSDAKQLKCLLGCSLEKAYQLINWPIEKLDPPRLVVWNEVRKNIWNTAMRLGDRQVNTEAMEMFRKAMAKDMFGGKE